MGRDIHITTRQLTLVPLNEELDQLQSLIWKLHKEGLENKGISNYSKPRNIKPRRTKMFSGNFWSLLERYCTRKKKKEELDIRLENIGFYKRRKKRDDRKIFKVV